MTEIEIGSGDGGDEVTGNEIVARNATGSFFPAQMAEEGLGRRHTAQIKH
jgi:hypothetical protein